MVFESPKALAGEDDWGTLDELDDAFAATCVMALEDSWVLAEHVGGQAAVRTTEGSGVDWDAALASYNAVRPEHCRRVVLTARAWGQMWHLEGLAREQRNAVLRGRETRDYSFTDWGYGATALVPQDEPELYRTTPLDEAAREAVLVR